MCSLSAATRWRHSDNCYYGKDRKLSFLVIIYSLIKVTCNGGHLHHKSNTVIGQFEYLIALETAATSRANFYAV